MAAGTGFYCHCHVGEHAFVGSFDGSDPRFPTTVASVSNARGVVSSGASVLWTDRDTLEGPTIVYRASVRENVERMADLDHRIAVSAAWNEDYWVTTTTADDRWSLSRVDSAGT